MISRPSSKRGSLMMTSNDAERAPVNPSSSLHLAPPLEPALHQLQRDRMRVFPVAAAVSGYGNGESFPSHSGGTDYVC